MEMHFILNPISNNKKSAQHFLEVEKFLKNSKCKFFVHKTKYPQHAVKIVKDITSKNKPVHIISVGGDGTLSDVLNGISDFKNTYLSILPLGSGNDFSLNFHEISQTDQIANVKRIINQKYTYIDFMEVNNKIRCINAIGAGVIPNVIKKYLSYKHFSQKTKYMLATFSKCLFFTVHNIKYSVDHGKTWEDVKTISFSIGNGQTVGGGLKLIPNASVNDGYISVSLIKKFNRLLTIHNLRKIMKGRTFEIKTYQGFKCKELLVRLDTKLYDVDGDIHQDTDKLLVKIVHNKLKFII